VSFRRPTAFVAAGFAALLLLGGLCVHAAAAQSSPTDADRPAQVAQLLDLLADPVVRNWLEHQRTVAPHIMAIEEETLSTALARRSAEIRHHIAGVVEMVPLLPSELARATRPVAAELGRAGRAFMLVATMALAGIAAEWVFRSVLRWAGFSERPTRHDRARNLAGIGERLLFGGGAVLAFASGVIGSFIAVDWPPLVRQTLLAYASALIALRLGTALLRVLLAPDAGSNGEVFRFPPMGNAAAQFWYRRIAVLMGWLVFGWATVDLAGALGVRIEARQLLAYLLGLGLLAIGIELAWRQPAAVDESGRRRRRVRAVLLSAYFVVLWLLWVASAMGLFWLAAVAAALPAAIAATQRTVDHVFGDRIGPTMGEERRGVGNVVVERGIRAGLIIVAVLLLARAWHIDLIALTASDDAVTRLARGFLGAVVVVFLADLVWELAKNAIDRVILETGSTELPQTQEAARRARLRTLLPLVRNLLLVTVLAIATMMILAAWGVAIGPLIAGAGVIGVALAFGAQTLVRDMVSGLFYLLDDAFRVGEYIQSGNYKGTVESFSLRSVKLRHHRGPLYTVPFGVLGAVQNMSRDWVIEKMVVSVTYDTDIERVKKIIKDIGRSLAEDPEFQPNLLETLKMQGIEQFGDFAVQIRMKMMTRPGEQFVIRRRAYALIKKAFEANGIKFAFPTVQVAGGAEAAAAAGKQAIELVQGASTAA
jgi:small-conductance mechanosensitive channel